MMSRRCARRCVPSLPHACPRAASPRPPSPPAPGTAGHQRSRRPARSTTERPAKARTAALGRRESKTYEDMINGGRTSFLSVPEVEGLLEGGVPVLVDGHCLGAVGVSGVKSNEDAQIARAGIAALAG